jgi:hypothetical protein
MPEKSEKEEIYDQEIAPLMTQIIETCRAHDIPLHATFYLGFVPVEESEEPGEMYVTTHLPGKPDSPVPFRLMRYAADSLSNFDSFIFRVKWDAEENGHTSVALQMFGVPVK